MKARVATILFRGPAAEPELVHILGDIPAGGAKGAIDTREDGS